MYIPSFIGFGIIYLSLQYHIEGEGGYVRCDETSISSFHIQMENKSQTSNIIVISLEIIQNKDRQLLPVLQSHCIDAIVVKAGENCG
jgi:hypothetical protein